MHCHLLVFILFICSVSAATIPEVGFEILTESSKFHTTWKGYDEVEFVHTPDELIKRKIGGRIYTGNDCEYIKISSITANSGCSSNDLRYMFEELFSINTLVFGLPEFY